MDDTGPASLNMARYMAHEAIRIEKVKDGKMKKGDLVKYKSPNNRWEGAWKEVGVIVRCIAGTDKCKVVQWATGSRCSYPERNLEVVNEGR